MATSEHYATKVTTVASAGTAATHTLDQRCVAVTIRNNSAIASVDVAALNPNTTATSTNGVNIQAQQEVTFSVRGQGNYNAAEGNTLTGKQISYIAVTNTPYLSFTEHLAEK